MGNGLATEWSFGTADFIRAFTAAGMATFNFDYRHFGASSGEPRQLLDFAKQLDDWRAALACLQARADVDVSRLALWGSSLGGGHALMLAAETPSLRAVVAQVPHLDSRQAMKLVPKWQLIRTVGHALRDKLGALLHGAPHEIPVLAEPGEIGLLTRPGWKAHYLSLVPVDSNWRNAVPARSVFTAGNYNPIDVVSRLQMPVMLAYGLRDAAIPAQNVERAAQAMADVTLLPFDDDHFGAYHGIFHDDVVGQETAFLSQHLQAAPVRETACGTGCEPCKGC
jgi:pimeloyl-ACP methyl ester carboxylesterase